MKCPLMPNKDYSEQLEKHLNKGDCLKEERAWWDKTAEKCVVLQLAFELDDVHCQLEGIANKMPHEGQFRDR